MSHYFSYLILLSLLSETEAEKVDNIDLDSKRFHCGYFFQFLHIELNELSVCELNEVLIELEAQIKENSEVLIAELAHRDELDYEKELKNSFISHLLAVQTKRRQHNLDRKKSKVGNGNLGGSSGGCSSNGNGNGEKTSTSGMVQSKVSFETISVVSRRRSHLYPPVFTL